MATILFGLLILLFLVNTPIALAIGIASAVAIIVGTNLPINIVVQRMFTGADSFPLMAIPFFMLAGEIMAKSGISERLVRFANALVGHIPGGLGMAAVLGGMFMAGVTGSAAADLAAIGTLMIPAMVANRYDPRFATSIQAASGSIGIVIPPSVPMIVYGVMASVSVGSLFLGGVIPGILLGLGYMAIAYVYAKRSGDTQEAVKQFSITGVVKSFVDAFLALLIPIIIVGGILGGAFTATEAAVIAVVYALVIGFFVFRSLRLSDLPEILVNSALSSASVMLLISAANVFSWIVAREQIPQLVANSLMSLSNNPYVVLFLINILLLIMGTFVETLASMIIIGPVLLPTVLSLGIDPVHFGVIMVVNLAIGMLTPPLGLCLFVSCGISKVPLTRIIRTMVPFLLVSIGVLFVITYFPDLVMWLPRTLNP